jgi:hypothetical protein
MQRTQDRIDGMAQYRITRRRAELERKDKEKEELRDTLTNLASLVGGDIDKAAQIYKGVGGTISSANEFFKVAQTSQRTMGKDFDISTAFDFATDNAPQGMTISQYLDNFTTSVKKLPVSDDEVPTTGLYGALFKSSRDKKKRYNSKNKERARKELGCKKSRCIHHIYVQ